VQIKERSTAAPLLQTLAKIQLLLLLLMMMMMMMIVIADQWPL